MIFSDNYDKFRMAQIAYNAELEKYPELKLIVLGPMQPRISKISGKYRYRMIVKCKNNSKFRSFMSELLVNFGKDTKFNDVSIFADINPESIL